MFYNAINAQYPNIEIIASTTAWTDQAGTSAGDYHDYSVRHLLIQLQNLILTISLDARQPRLVIHPVQ